VIGDWRCASLTPLKITGEGSDASGVQPHSETEVRDLSASALRVIGFLFLVAAAVLAILNLKRVANLGMPWISPPLMIIGIAFVAMAARKK
jgi:hypothetical protein